MREILLVRFGEVHLKGQNRPQFLRALVENVRGAARPFAGHVWMREGRIYVRDMTDAGACAEAVARVFGIHSVSIAAEMEKGDLDAVLAEAALRMRGLTGTFKVKARRSDKRYPVDSPTICRLAGERILKENPQLTVDVKRPMHTLEIEIRDMATLHTGRIAGAGGMPMGTGGRACLLLSGGIDSPVAGYMIARRGVRLTAVHFHSFPYTSDRARAKVVELARILSGVAERVELFVVPFTEIQMRIQQKGPEPYSTLLMRRQMMRIAESIARREGAQALITGESIGQVASQTIEALAVTDDACGVPVFRPLIGFDKADITAVAERIGTFETSTLPYEDCCTVFTPKHPATHPKLARIREAEDALGDDLAKMAETAANEAVRVLLLGGRVVSDGAAEGNDSPPVALGR